MITLYSDPIDPYTQLRLKISRWVMLSSIVVFIIGSLLPPYIPSSGQVDEIPLVSQKFQLAEEGFLMKTSPIISQRPRPTRYGQIVTVQPGDNLQRLATKYELELETLLWANALEEDHQLEEGDKIRIPSSDGVLHKVNANETLLAIAQKYSIESGLIVDANGIVNSLIRTDEFILIPGGKPLPKPTVIANVPNTTTPPAAQPQPTAPPTAVATTPPQPPIKPTAGFLENPCPGCDLTQGFRHGHYALDMARRGGGPLYAAKEGTVITSDFGWNGGYGNYIEIDHGNGLVTLYAHNKTHYVEVGDYVSRGDHIADMGNTGRVYGVTGIHVHFEVIQDGYKKNPILYLE